MSAPAHRAQGHQNGAKVHQRSRVHCTSRIKNQTVQNSQPCGSASTLFQPHSKQTCLFPANILVSSYSVFPIRGVQHQHYFSHVRECLLPSKHIGPFQHIVYHQECSQSKMTLFPSPLTRRARGKLSVLRGMIVKDSSEPSESVSSMLVWSDVDEGPISTVITLSASV